MKYQVSGKWAICKDVKSVSPYTPLLFDSSVRLLSPEFKCVASGKLQFQLKKHVFVTEFYLIHGAFWFDACYGDSVGYREMLVLRQNPLESTQQVSKTIQGLLPLSPLQRTNFAK